MGVRDGNRTKPESNEQNWKCHFVKNRTDLTRPGRKTPRGGRVHGRVNQNNRRDKWRKYVHGVTNPRIEDG